VLNAHQEGVMLNRMRLAGCVCGFIAIVAAAGCAGRRDAGSSTAMQGRADVAPFDGVWEGQVWEMPVHYIQGVRPITLKIAKDGTWTATTAGTQCASGTASVHGSVVILGGTKSGQDYCVPYSLSTNDGRMKGVFATSFKGRQGSAMIGLDRRSDAPQASAR
jgi:hypothetical protein